MANRNIEVSIPDEVLARVHQTLSKVPGQKITEQEIKRLLSLAIKQWCEILLQSKRSRSLTDLYLTMLRDIYAELLTEEAPSDARLFGRMNFPFGQSQYLVRVLLEDQPVIIRQKAVSDLEAELAKKSTMAKEWIKKDKGTDRMSFNISRESYRELDIVMGTLVENGDVISPARKDGVMGKFYSVLLAAQDLETIIKAVASHKKQLKDSI